METLESQVAKILIGDFKKTSSYVYILAEKAPVGAAELYLVAELALFNPAAESSAETICLSIASALKRAYRKPSDDSTFENAIAQINEELGKLAELDRAHWIDKLNCVAAVKEEENFSIATCGKVAAFLLRNGELTDISCSAAVSQPGKAFENIAAGQLKLGDVFILSTTQLFNYLSADRLRGILAGNAFLIAAQQVIEILKETAGPDAAFGTVLNMQVEQGRAEEEQVDLDDYGGEEDDEPEERFWEKTLAYLKTMVGTDQYRRKPAVELPKKNWKQRLRGAASVTKSILGKSGSALAAGTGKLADSRKNLKLQNFKSYSRAKKFFFVSVLVLFAALVADIAITVHTSNLRKSRQQQAVQLSALQILAGKAQSLLLFKDYNGAKAAITELESNLPKDSQIPAGQKQAYAALLAQVGSLKLGLDKTASTTVTNLGNLGQSNTLLKLPPFLAVQSGSGIISYNQDSGAVQDGQLLSSENILSDAPIKPNTAAVFNEKGLMVWNYDKKTFSPPFTQSVPAKDALAGMAYYSTNSRVYVADKNSGQIVSFAVTDKLARPLVSVTDAGNIGTAQDIAIDGSVYVLNGKGLLKYTAGKLQDFKLPDTFTPFGGTGKIFTTKDAKNIYILDANNKRVIVTDKKGQLVETLISGEFTKPTDFSVDEKNKVMYVLNNGSLLKATLP